MLQCPDYFHFRTLKIAWIIDLKKISGLFANIKIESIPLQTIFLNDFLIN